MTKKTHFLNLSSTTHLRSSPRSRNPSQWTTSPADRNFRHWSDKHLLLAMARQRFSFSHLMTLTCHYGFWPNFGGYIYSFLAKESSTFYFILFFKPYSTSCWLKRRSICRYKTSSHSPERRRNTTKQKSHLIKIKSLPKLYNNAGFVGVENATRFVMNCKIQYLLLDWRHRNILLSENPLKQ
jgi:hypothetical protein